MPTPDVNEVLTDPLAEQLMASPIPARMAYTARDGSPRVVPIGFHWDRTHFVICTVPHAPKVRALEADPRVALTIDTNDFPPHVLLVRGTARMERVDGVPAEFLVAAHKSVPEGQWDAYDAGVRGLYKEMVRITITPEWAKLLDFDTRLPSPIEQLIRESAAG